MQAQPSEILLFPVSCSGVALEVSVIYGALGIEEGTRQINM